MTQPVSQVFDLNLHNIILKGLNILYFIFPSYFAYNITYFIFHNSRSSRLEVFGKKGVLRNFAKFTIARVSFLKSCRPVNFAIFLRKPFLTENLRWLLLQFIIHISCISYFMFHLSL